MTARVSRRVFLGSSGLAALGVGFHPSSLLERTAHAAGAVPRVLVKVFLRGGCDGLNLCVPYGDAQYAPLRGTIALPRPDQSGGVIDLDGYFGLHPSLAALKPLYDARRLAFLQAVGNYSLTRSHFDAQDFMEAGTPGNKSTTTGWLGRAIAAIPGGEVTEAVAFSAQLPRTLLGTEPVLTASNVATFDLRAPNWFAEAETLLRGLYDVDPVAASQVGRDTFAAIDLLRGNPALTASPSNGAVYPAGTIGAGLRQAAQIIRAGLGTRCIFVNVGGAFDSHSGQLGAHTLEFPRIADALVAFDRDLGTLMEDVLVMVTTEFGRAAFVNGSGGTDHGSAHCMIFLGAGVRGGRVHGPWPGLSNAQLYQQRDLAVTTDFRDAFAEVARVHLGIGDTASLFPGYTLGSGPGVVA